MRVSLVGVSCVGTTTVGRILADRRGWPFFDLDEEIERHFGTSIERLQARFLTGYSYRKECAVVLERIAAASPDCVIALPPSGLTAAARTFRLPGVTSANVAALLQFSAAIPAFFFVTLYLQEVQRYSALRAGLAFLPLAGGAIVITPSASWLVGRFGPAPTLTAAFTTAGLPGSISFRNSRP